MKIIAFLVLSIVSISVSAQATVAGFTPGSFRVTESGAAEYRIPIRVPPGIGGMEPKLALVYNSQAGNGLLGVGWNLEGLSAIGRCPRTMAQDGVRGGVNYDANDRFCLDGQRLMAISGAYGADGTEYRTERESFTRVISYGAAGNGPAWFKAWTKSGQIIEYGNTSDSRIEAQGKTTVRVWAANKVSDTKGNYLTVSYTEDNANGEYVPAEIGYGYASSIPAASVTFTYASRPDVRTAWRGGSVSKLTKRLTHVRTYLGAALVTSLETAYDNAGAGSASRITGVTECAGSGSCFAPTTVSYAATAVWSSSGSNWPLPSAANTNGYYSKTDSVGTYLDLIDLNGDGLVDLYWSGSSTAYLGTGAGFSATGTNWPLPAAANASGYMSKSDSNGTYLGLVDLNGDGLPDLYWSGSSTAYLNTGTGFSSSGTGWPIPSGANASGYYTKGSAGSYFIGVVDLNGDGLPDLYNSGQSTAWLNTGSGFSASGTSWPLPAAANTSGYYARSDGSGSKYIGLVDLNGDGLPDLYNSGQSTVWLNTGNGFSTTGTSWPLPAAANAAGYYEKASGGSLYLGLLDLNGDGLPDLYWSGNSTVWFNTGTGFAATGTGWPLPPASTGGYYRNGGNYPYHGVYDLDGDGLPDFYWSGNSTLYRSTKPKNDQANTIVASDGRTIAISYKAIADSTAYTKEAAALPQLALGANISVVTQASVSNGIGGSIVTNYAYGGALANTQGRGFLGFRWQSSEQASGLAARIELRQDWPYVGMPSIVKRTHGAGAVLSEVTNTYGCTDPATGGGCTVAAGNRYFPFASQSVEISNDLNGALFQNVTTTTQYDTFGDATSVVVSTGDGYSKTTTNTYANDSGNWFLGRLIRSAVQSTAP